MTRGTVARELVAIATILAKGEVPEAFKKQWKDKDKDNDGKENEPMPEGLKKHLEQKKAGEVPEAFKKQWKKNEKDDSGDKKEDKKPDFLKKKDATVRKAADEVTMDVPFLIRVMEYAKEDAETDMDLHSAVERMLDLSEEGGALTMEDYDSIFASEKGKTARAWEPMRKDIDVRMRNKEVHESLTSFAPSISKKMRVKVTAALKEMGYDVSPRDLDREWSTYLSYVDYEANNNKYHYYVVYSFETDSGETLYTGWNCSGRIGIIERAYDMTKKFLGGPVPSLNRAIAACEKHLKTKERKGYQRAKMVRG